MGDLPAYGQWSNYPTYCTYKWLTNGQLEDDVAKAVVFSAQHGEYLLKKYVTDLVTADLVENGLKDGCAVDLLDWSLSNVDWLELGDGLIEALA